MASYSLVWNLGKQVQGQPVLGCRIGWLGAHGVVWLCSISLVVCDQFVILSDKEPHLMTFNPDYTSPFSSITLGYVRKYFEVFIKIVIVFDGSQCHVILLRACWGPPPVSISVVTCCKLAKLGWNKIESQKTFSENWFHLYRISDLR